MGRSRYWRFLTVLLFVTVCAYAGAALLRGLAAPAERAEQTPPAENTIPLSGIAVRRETRLDPDKPMPEDGQRLPAGTRLSDTYTAPGSVIYFQGSDSLESLSPDTLTELSVPALRDILDTAVPAFSRSGGRAVLGFDWYYAALTDSETALAVGQRRRLRFDGAEESVPARVIAVSEALDGKRAVVFRLTAGEDFYLKLRLCQAELIE